MAARVAPEGQVEMAGVEATAPTEDTAPMGATVGVAATAAREVMAA